MANTRKTNLYVRGGVQLPSIANPQLFDGVKSVVTNSSTLFKQANQKVGQFADNFKSALPNCPTLVKQGTSGFNSVSFLSQNFKDTEHLRLNSNDRESFSGHPSPLFCAMSLAHPIPFLFVLLSGGLLLLNGWMQLRQQVPSKRKGKKED